MYVSNISKHLNNIPSTIIVILQHVTYYWFSNFILCSHMAAILNLGGHIDFQVGVPIKNERKDISI